MKCEEDAITVEPTIKGPHASAFKIDCTDKTSVVNPSIEAFDSALAEWFAAHVRNSPVSRHTDAVNHLNAVLPKLRDNFISKLNG